MTPAPAPLAPTPKPRPKDPMPPTSKPTTPPMLNITVARSALLHALRAAEDVTNPKSTLPAYACAHLHATADGLTVRATNGYQAVSTVVTDATVRVPGLVLLPALDLRRRIEALPEGAVTLTERAEGKVEAKGGQGRYILSSLRASDAPAIPSPAPEGHEIDAAALAGLIDRVKPTACDEQSRESLYGVNLVGGRGRLCASAFNGYAAVEAWVTFDGTLSAFVPFTALSSLSRLLSRVDGTVRLSVVGQRLCIWGAGGDGLAYSTALSAAPFADLTPLWRPCEGPYLRVSPTELRAAVKAVDLGLVDQRVRLRPTADGVTVWGSTESGGPAERALFAACSIESVSVVAAHLARMVDFLAAGVVEDAAVRLYNAAGDRRVGGRPEMLRAEGEDGRCFAMPLLFDTLDLADAPAADEEEAA